MDCSEERNQKKEDYNKDCSSRVDVAAAVGELQSSDPVVIVGCAVAFVATIHALVSATIFGGCSVTVSDDDAYYFLAENVGDEDLSIPYVAAAVVVLYREEGYEPKILGSIFCTVDQGEGGCDDGQEPEVMMNKVEEDRMMVKEDVEELAGMSWMKKGEVSVLTGYELRADDDDD